MIKISTLLLCGLLAASAPLGAQIKTPAPSPVCKFSQDIGLVNVDLEYSRPSAKGRKIFGDLVVFGELWRTGANASTKITFSDEITVGDTKLPGKQYALYTIPGPTEWTVIFYKETKFWGVPGEDYREEDVAARIVVRPQQTADRVETFTISLDNVQNKGADLTISWENTRVIVPLKVDTDAKVLADIKTQMEGPSAGTFYSAGRYFFEEKKDMRQALDWVNRALDKGGDKFWILQLKSKILAELGQYADAIATAEKSSDLARKENNSDYPRANDKLIAEWRKKAGGK